MELRFIVWNSGVRGNSILQQPPDCPSGISLSEYNPRVYNLRVIDSLQGKER